jgi:MarR family transcriptional regulator, organic hydroperoxide resistance regulator
MKPEETIDHPIRWAWHRIARRYNAEAAKHGGTMSIGYVLLTIDPEGTPSTKLGPKPWRMTDLYAVPPTSRTNAL